MSGYLPKPREPTVTAAGRTTPILMLHGEADGVVRFSFAEATKSALEGHGVEEVELKSYADLEHSANLQEIEDLAAFLKRVLP
jgi:predicted esterase